MSTPTIDPSTCGARQHTMFSYPANICHIFISPGHNYFGRPKDGPGAHPTHDVAQVEVRAGLGLVGDRYFGVAAHFNAQVTLVAWEVFAEVQRAFGAHELSPVLLRRNIVVEGIPLNQLIGQEFTIVDASGAAVRLQGASHCAPCAWMDAALGAGAWQLLKGRGGLRARILSDGVLHRGPVHVQTDVELDISTVTAPVARPRLPA